MNSLVKLRYTSFAAIEYFSRLASSNLLALSNGFKFADVSGTDSLEGLLLNFKSAKNFILFTDTLSQDIFEDGVNYEGLTNWRGKSLRKQFFCNGSGYFRRDVYTVFILMHYRYNDMSDRDEKLDICREIFRQMNSRILYDRDCICDERLTYLNLENVFVRELSGYEMNGVTGLCFMIQNEQPIDISYDSAEWVK